MSHPYVTKKKAHNLSTGILLIGLAVLSYLDQWWPGILLVIGVAFAFRQALLGKWYDACFLCFVFGGIFSSYFFPFRILVMPVVFLVAGIYLLFRDVSEPEEFEEEEYEIQKELEDKEEEA